MPRPRGSFTKKVPLLIPKNNVFNNVSLRRSFDTLGAKYGCASGRLRTFFAKKVLRTPKNAMGIL